MNIEEVPDAPQELPDVPPLESPPFQEPIEPFLPDTPEPELPGTPESEPE